MQMWYLILYYLWTLWTVVNNDRCIKFIVKTMQVNRSANAICFHRCIHFGSPLTLCYSYCILKSKRQMVLMSLSIHRTHNQCIFFFSSPIPSHPTLKYYLNAANKLVQYSDSDWLASQDDFQWTKKKNGFVHTSAKCVTFWYTE